MKKNGNADLNGAEEFPKSFFYHGNGDASIFSGRFEFIFLFVLFLKCLWRKSSEKELCSP
jgi:hypothetical protein